MAPADLGGRPEFEDPEHELKADDGLRVIHTPRCEIFAPPRGGAVAREQHLGVDAQAVTPTAHAWTAVVRNPAPGVHTIVDALFTDGRAFRPLARHYGRLTG